MKNKIEAIIQKLDRHKDWLDQKRAVIGFDGFIDCIVHVVKSKEPSGETTFFSSIAEFGTYISQKNGMNCSLELEEKVVKFGGNMPIMSNAIGSLGIKTSCLGAMGFPEIRSEFKDMSSNCNLISYAAPGVTSALEFNDGKVMLANFGSMHKINWKYIIDRVGIDKIIDLINNSDLIGLVNWSDIKSVAVLDLDIIVIVFVEKYRI